MGTKNLKQELIETLEQKVYSGDRPPSIFHIVRIDMWIVYFFHKNREIVLFAKTLPKLLKKAKEWELKN